MGTMTPHNTLCEDDTPHSVGCDTGHPWVTLGSHHAPYPLSLYPLQVRVWVNVTTKVEVPWGHAMSVVK